MRGGDEGQPGYVEIVRADGSKERFYKGERAMRPDDVVHFVSGGGGGYGPGWSRPSAAVASDVKEGYVSRAAAASDYGVVIGNDLSVDDIATNQLRSKQREAISDEQQTTSSKS